MTTRENRGGARVPDGQPRVPLAGSGNRSDLSALPGTPGTALPPNPTQPNVGFGEAGNIRRRLQQIPLDRFQPGQPLLSRGTESPREPVTAGVDTGAGPGSEALLGSPMDMGNRAAAGEVRYFYPIIMKLASLPNASTQTKLLAQRLRANLSVKPEQMPLLPQEIASGVPGQTQGDGGRGG